MMALEAPLEIEEVNGRKFVSFKAGTGPRCQLLSSMLKTRSENADDHEALKKIHVINAPSGYLSAGGFRVRLLL